MTASLNGIGVTFNDGTIQNTAASPGGFQLFTSSGTFTVPENVTSIKVTVVGGGGGGGDTYSDGYGTYTGGTGGGGGMAAGFISVLPGQTHTVTVGSGGNGSNSGNGAAGGTSSFGAYLVATGGGGGSGSTGADGAAGSGSGTATNSLLFTNPSVTTVRPRASGTSNATAVSYVVGSASNRSAGSGGAGESSSGNNAAGGVGGAVLVEW